MQPQADARDDHRPREEDRGMIPKEVAEIADLIAPGWSEMDEETSGEVIRAAYRLHNAGYRKHQELAREA